MNYTCEGSLGTADSGFNEVENVFLSFYKQTYTPEWIDSSSDPLCTDFFNRTYEKRIVSCTYTPTGYKFEGLNEYNIKCLNIFIEPPKGLVVVQDTVEEQKIGDWRKEILTVKARLLDSATGECKYETEPFLNTEKLIYWNPKKGIEILLQSEKTQKKMLVRKAGTIVELPVDFVSEVRILSSDIILFDAFPLGARTDGMDIDEKKKVIIETKEASSLYMLDVNSLNLESLYKHENPDCELPQENNITLFETNKNTGTIVAIAQNKVIKGSLETPLKVIDSISEKFIATQIDISPDDSYYAVVLKNNENNVDSATELSEIKNHYSVMVNGKILSELDEFFTKYPKESGWKPEIEFKNDTELIVRLKNHSDTMQVCVVCLNKNSVLEAAKTVAKDCASVCNSKENI